MRDNAGMSSSAQPASLEVDPHVCIVCGAAIEDDAAIEDSNGWRWLSDGQGSLLPLCPTCPLPTDVADYALN